MRVTIPDALMLTWQSQVVQYPLQGEPGISYFRGDVEHGKWVDCLLYRDENGYVIGILNHYPTDMPPWEKEGNMNMWVRPDKHRKGIGTALLDEAIKRWPFNPVQQRYSDKGLSFILSYIQRRSEKK